MRIAQERCVQSNKSLKWQNATSLIAAITNLTYQEQPSRWNPILRHNRREHHVSREEFPKYRPL